jgi:hypothetical protein
MKTALKITFLGLCFLATTAALGNDKSQHVNPVPVSKNLIVNVNINQTELNNRLVILDINSTESKFYTKRVKTSARLKKFYC